MRRKRIRDWMSGEKPPVQRLCAGLGIAGSPDKAECSAPLGADREQATGPAECNSNQPMHAVIAVKRAIILLRFDWLTGSIGALLW
jgi:hypothetical protein